MKLLFASLTAALFAVSNLSAFATGPESPDRVAQSQNQSKEENETLPDPEQKDEEKKSVEGTTPEEKKPE